MLIRIDTTKMPQYMETYSGDPNSEVIKNWKIELEEMNAKLRRDYLIQKINSGEFEIVDEEKPLPSIFREDILELMMKNAEPIARLHDLLENRQRVRKK